MASSHHMAKRSWFRSHSRSAQLLLESILLVNEKKSCFCKKKQRSTQRLYTCRKVLALKLWSFQGLQIGSFREALQKEKQLIGCLIGQKFAILNLPCRRLSRCLHRPIRGGIVRNRTLDPI